MSHDLTAVAAQPPSSPTAALREVMRTETGKAIIGHEEAIELITAAAIAGGHILLEGPPGIAKTLLANTVAHVLGVKFNRLQFTPDTTPSHIAGETMFRMGEPQFVPGPVFTNLLLADEINRTSARTQAALLEAMQEHQVTVDGATHFLPEPFMVIATQNPYEQEGVHPLPESQLDRFLFKVEMEYGTADQELSTLALPHTGLSPDVIGAIRPMLNPALLVNAQREIDEAIVPESVARYVVEIVRATRSVPAVRLGASSRAARHLLTAARANTRLDGREEVTAADVEMMAGPVLRHRLMMANGNDPRAAVEVAVEMARASLGSRSGVLRGEHS
jgi:MoxR-like ATPase